MSGRSTPPGLSRRDRAITRISRWVAGAHTAVIRRSGGRIGSEWLGGDVLLLTVRGRRSGRAFTVPMLYLREGGDLVVAASNGGVDREPQWWLNLRADPGAEVEIRGRRLRVVASEVHRDERTALWARLVVSYADYDKYRSGVRRRIAVVRLRAA